MKKVSLSDIEQTMVRQALEHLFDDMKEWVPPPECAEQHYAEFTALKKLMDKFGSTVHKQESTMNPACLR